MAHFYDRNGVAHHQVRRADGKGLRDTHVGDARKNDWLPGVTDILKMVQSEGLERYKIRQAIYAAETLPRIEGETSDQRVARIMSDADEHARQARDRGSEIHEIYTRYFHGQEIRAEDARYAAHLSAFHAAEIHKVHWSERCLVAGDYAGTADLYFQHKIHGNILADFKGQDVKDDRAVIYKNYMWQIAAYVQALELKGEKPDGGAVIVFDRNTGKLYPWYYSRAELEPGVKAFNAAKTLWQIDREYVPGQKVEKKKRRAA